MIAVGGVDVVVMYTDSVRQRVSGCGIRDNRCSKVVVQTVSSSTTYSTSKRTEMQTSNGGSAFGNLAETKADSTQDVCSCLFGEGI